MKKIILLAFVFLFCTTPFALEFRPVTVKSMDVTITAETRGGFSGTITQGDELEILFLSVQEDRTQEIYYSEEYMEIAGEKILPKTVERNGLKYASYKISDLYDYARDPVFTIVRKTGIRKEAELGLQEDYNIAQGITAFTEYTRESDYIEANDRELKSKAAIEFTSDSGIGAMREITEWVNRNIEYDFENYYSGVYSAKETYNAKAGVCDEFANLTAAFMRIRGIPAKYVTGVSFDGLRFGLHGWIEAYLPLNGWLGVDSTYGEAGYLDAAHFSVAKTMDANDAIDFIAKTRSREPIEVTSETSVEVEINSVEFFENLLEAEITVPEKVEAGETFEIKAKLGNVSGKSAVLPVELLLHENFGFKDGKRLVYFEKGEEKELVWTAKAPDESFKGGYYSYGMALLLPDGNKSGTINVYPVKKAVDEEAYTRVRDVSPFIDANVLRVEITIENKGGKDGKAGAKIFFEGNQLNEKSIEVKALAENKIVFIVSNIKQGKVRVEVYADENKNIEFAVPEITAESAAAGEVEIEVVESPPETAESPYEISEGTVLAAGLGITLAGIIIALGLVAGILLRK